jgi:hypothetical protein
MRIEDLKRAAVQTLTPVFNALAMYYLNTQPVRQHICYYAEPTQVNKLK